MPEPVLATDYSLFNLYLFVVPSYVVVCLVGWIWYLNGWNSLARATAFIGVLIGAITCTPNTSNLDTKKLESEAGTIFMLLGGLLFFVAYLFPLKQKRDLSPVQKTRVLASLILFVFGLRTLFGLFMAYRESATGSYQHSTILSLAASVLLVVGSVALSDKKAWSRWLIICAGGVFVMVMLHDWLSKLEWQYLSAGSVIKMITLTIIYGWVVKFLLTGSGREACLGSHPQKTV